MKRLSDYQGEAAIELWMELLEPLTDIFSDKEVQNAITSGGSTLSKAKTVLKNHKKEAAEILLAIDDTPINGLNIILRLVNLLLEFEHSEDFADFFGSSAEATKESASSGSVTAITEEKGN